MRPRLVFVRPALWALLAVVLSCGAIHAAPAAPPPRVVLSMWCSPYAAEAGWAIEMVSLWNRTHPDVQVRLRKMPSERVAEDVIRDAIRDGKTPDLCAHMFPVNVHEFVKMGGLLPLDPYPSLLRASAARSGSGDAFRSSDGRLYQIPWKCNPIMLQYNKALISGGRPPRTYGEFLAQAETLRKKGIHAWAPTPEDRWYTRYYDFYPLYLAASGGQTFLDSSGAPAIDEAAAIAVTSFIAATFSRGAAPSSALYRDPTAQNEAFAAGRLAFLVTGPWNIQLITELAGSTVDFGFAPLMVPDGTDPKRPVVTYGNFRNISIFRSCKHPAEAAALTAFLISRAADVAFMQTTSQLPYRIGLLNDPTFRPILARERHLLAFARQLGSVRPVENTPLFNDILSLLSRHLVACAVKGERTPAQAVRDAIDEMNQLTQRR